MLRLSALVAVLGCACGDLDGDRICINPPCMIPGRSSPACQDFLACYARTGGDVSSLQPTYGNGGACWTSGAMTADSCTAACTSATTSLRGMADGGC